VIRRLVGSGWLLFGVALALRTGWVGYRWATHGPGFDYDDEKLHWQLATHLVRDCTLVSDDGRHAARMPLYPLFLALFAWAGTYGLLAARLAQAAVGALTAVLARRWAGAAWGPRAAWVAGLLACVDPFGIFFANLLLTETVFTLLLLALVGCAWGVVMQPASKWVLIGLALLGAAAVMTRPAVVLLVPLLWLLVGMWSGDRRRTWLRLVLCPLVLAAALLPWGLRNKAVLGSFAWLSTNGGVTLYDAQGPQADGSSNQAFLQDTPAFRRLDEVTLDRTLARRAAEQMRADPARVLRLAGVKLVRTWSPIPNVAEYRRGAIAFVGAVYTLAVLLGAVAGLARPAGRRAWHALLWVPVVYFTLVHCVYIGSVRYRVPLMPLLGVAAASVAGPSAAPKPARQRLT
jgi:4-amino-4-deoxy-L-arabinose transferase-like glycosyltransferase